MIPFERLQQRHLELIKLVEEAKSPDNQLITEVEDFIKDIREAGSLISDPKQRNQLRTLLRYWGSFIYDQKGEFPDTQLLPINPDVEKQVGLESKRQRRWFSLSVIAGIFIIILAVVFLSHFFESSQPDVVVIKEWGLRKTSDSSSDSNIKEILSKGTTLTIIGQAEGGYWLYVRSNTSGQEGWIANRTDGVSVNVSLSNIPVVNTPTPKPTAQPYDCTTIVVSSRPLIPNGTGDECWLELSKEVPAELTFNEPAQITYGTLTGGNDRFFFIAEKGDRLLDVTGATIRPMRHVELKFGSLDNLKNYEIDYHSGRVEGGWETCLRDHNDGDKPLTALCNE